MKKLINILVAVAFLLSTQTMMAQVDDDIDPEVIEQSKPKGEDGEDSNEGDVVIEFSIGGNEKDTTTNFITRWFTLGLGVNPVNVEGDFDLPQGEFYNDWDLRIGKSTNVDLGIVQQKVNLVNHHLYLNTGIGLDINKYMFDNNFIISRDAETWQTTDITADVKKNRLTSTYLHIPLMLNFESGDSHYRSSRINLGGFAGFRLGTNQKVVFKDRDDNPIDNKKTYKERDNYNLNPFTYGLKAEVGFGPINLYGKYHLNDMFKDQTAEPLNNMSFGLMIVPF